MYCAVCVRALPPLQSTGFHILCGLVIGIFILAELGLNEAVIYLSNKVQQNGIAAAIH
jgi:Flp pilus assembly protein protease CpaA